MGTSAIVLAFVASSALGQSVHEGERERIDEVFQQLWGVPFSWKLESLPANGQVDDQRIPYSGAIYTHRGGGTMNALRKYDRAFHAGRYPATGHERWDTSAKERRWVRGPLGIFGRQVTYSPHWYGHCNGWAAAAIRHAEPQTSVERNGVVFSPSDIKALLAEIYVYNHSQSLVGAHYRLNPGSLHAFICNWIGRGAHPIAMEADPGSEKWNYPIYAYSTAVNKRSDREVEVKMTVSYSLYLAREMDKSEHNSRTKYFHYMLSLDEDGMITGGYFYRDSSSVDFLWIPMRPKQSGDEENERGNPHVDVDEVLAIWRASVPEQTRNTWHVIDPPKADRLTTVDQFTHLVPNQDLATVQQPVTSVAATETPGDGS